ncbi:Uncharacterised protein [uncultured archaeon]|nr:Uncharacterised protein [uncultured archaeon]
MRKLIVSEFLTLDGVFEDPGGSEKTKYGGWSFEFWNEQAMKFKQDELFAADALLLGRVTYQGFAAAWPSMKDEQGFADRMNSIPKYVVSTTLHALEWNNSHLIKENIIEEIKKLKQEESQDILVFGSGILVKTLIQENLIDEYRLMIHPMILGTGRHLFKEGIEKTKLKLLNTEKFDTGIIVLTYEAK